MGFFYNNALKFVESDQKKERDKLWERYDNPTYYAGFYLTSIIGNIGILGSVPAEQNYSVNISRMGLDAIWFINKEIVELMKKHQHYRR